MDWNNDGKLDLIVGDTDGLIWIFLNTGTDRNPVLAKGQKLQVGGKEYKPTGGRSKPWVVDWDNDGKQDLICGVEDGEVLLLLNAGTAKAPSFAKATPLKLGNKHLKGGMRVCPVVWDWNKDGKKDLLCADEFGKVTFFENTGTDASPVLKEGVPVQARGGPISAPPGSSAKGDLAGDGQEVFLYFSKEGTIEVYCRETNAVVEVEGRPFKVDASKIKMSTVLWNEDKKADLLLGQEDGRVLLLISRCANDKWAFDKPVVLQDGNKPLRAGPRPFPALEDWNKDGKKDLVCYSTDGQVYWFENQGTDAERIFNGRKTAPKDFSPIYGGYRSQLTVADWNNDGKPDLLYGVTDNDSNQAFLYLFSAE